MKRYKKVQLLYDTDKLSLMKRGWYDMPKIPIAEVPKIQKISPANTESLKRQRKVCFSFAAVDKNEYFNLDGTCQNWAADLFDTMQKVSNISVSEIYNGTYSHKGSPFRIHQHDSAKPPCRIPDKVSQEDMWQIRISTSKGGIHGVFVDNIFYVIWFDPQHNLYPDENHGGLKKVMPPSTCCKDRDAEISELKKRLAGLEEEKDRKSVV